MGCYFNFCPCQEARPILTDDDINRGTKKREMDGLRKDYIREKGYFKEEMWDCSWWEKIRNETMFGSVQCDLSVPDELKAKFSNFPPIFINIDVTRNINGENVKT